MKKRKLTCGLTYYTATASETMLLGGSGICDDCGQPAAKGYLVPVLNHYQCKECFEGFRMRAKYYPEDEPIEQKNCRYYEQMIPME